MQCPIKLVKNGNSPNGNYLMARFDGDSKPDKVRVVVNGIPTNDLDGLNGNSGVWNSRYKYASPAVTIQLLDASGQILNNCTYDTSGQPTPTKNVVISGSNAKPDGNGNVMISWQSVSETGLKSYIVERINSNTGSKDRADIPEPNLRGAGGSYSVKDDEIFEDTSVYSYNILANYMDNTTAPLVQHIPVS